MPPESNPTYIKVNDGAFYLATTSSTFYNVDVIANEIQALRDSIDERITHLQQASAQGVSEADTVLQSIQNQPLSTLL